MEKRSTTYCSVFPWTYSVGPHQHADIRKSDHGEGSAVQASSQYRSPETLVRAQSLSLITKHCTDASRGRGVLQVRQFNTRPGGSEKSATSDSNNRLQKGW
jgi:hypothetical protein